MHPYDVVTFDCYGTLIDWEAGIREAFRTAATHAGVPLVEADVIPAYSRAEATVEQQRWLPYRQVLQEAAARAARELGWPAGAARGDFLAQSLPSWQPFPDTNRGLERLQEAGCELGILSNVDDDLLAETRRHFTVDFAIIVTAQQVRAYKPAHAHFLAARERIGSRRWLHAAQSSFHDIVPATALGIPTAWINRKGTPALPGGQPAMEFATLEEMAHAVAPPRSRIPR